MIRILVGVVALGVLAGPAGAQTALFASDEPLRLEISGPITAIAKGPRDAPRPTAAQMSIAGTGVTHPIRLTPRGITRLRRETCSFPPLRVEFAPLPGPPSPFAGQGRLKLVTHCQSTAGFQQHVLLEYAAYRLYNLLTPQSFRARLATIDYIDQDRRPFATRVGFFIEDRDDVGRRMGMGAAAVGDMVAARQLDAASSARFAMFEYMIGNLDWSMRAGPPGEGCCHNSRLFTAPNAASAGANLIPVPYDFDFSGLVGAPYATPPEGYSGSVRRRFYRGYCAHNAQARAAAADMRAKRPAIMGELARIPGLDPSSQRRAIAYLDEFFADIATDQRLADKVLKNCVG